MILVGILMMFVTSPLSFLTLILWKCTKLSNYIKICGSSSFGVFFLPPFTLFNTQTDKKLMDYSK